MIQTNFHFMKKTYSFILVFAILFVSYSCKKKEEKDRDDSTETSTPVLSPFKLTLNNTTSLGNSIQISHVSGYIGIQAVVSDTLHFGISIADSITVGTYSINSNSPFRVTHSDDNFQTMFYSTTGSVKILTHDKTAKKISGTYSCNLNRINPATMKTINAAEFNVSYQ